MYIYKSLSKLNEMLRLNRYEKPLSPLCFCTAHLENFVINQEQNQFSRNHLLYFHYVIKELDHAFSCAYIKLWMHLASLESAQEARIALGVLQGCQLSRIIRESPDFEPYLQIYVCNLQILSPIFWSPDLCFVISQIIDEFSYL